MQDPDWLSTICPLPIRVNPLPWESLISFITRTAQAMGYPYPQWLLWPENIPYRIPLEACNLHNIISYRVLERFLCLSEEVLYNLTFHRFATQMQLPGEGLLGSAEELQRPLLTKGTSNRFVASHNMARVCPICLIEDPCYEYLYWAVLPIIACPIHGCLLVDRCPVCHKSIPLLRPSLTHCRRCQKGDYRQAPVTILQSDLLLSTCPVLDHLRISKVNVFGTKEYIQSPLARLGSWQYFRLLDAFRFMLTPLFPDGSFLQVSPEVRAMLREKISSNGGLSPYEWFVLLETFHYIFERWPDNFFKFLSTFPFGREHKAGAGIHSHFGVLYKWLYKRLEHTDFTFLREAFSDYLKKRYTGGSINRHILPFRGASEASLQESRYVPMQQAMDMLGIYGKVSGVKTLISAGVLHAVKVQSEATGRHLTTLVERLDVEVLSREWNDLIPRKMVQRSFLGIGVVNMLSLVHAGLLAPVRGRTIDQHRDWLYKRTDVEQFIATMVKHVKKDVVHSEDDVPLFRVPSIIKMKFVDTLNAVFDGSLVLIDTETSQPLFHRLTVSGKEIRLFLEMKDRQRRENLKLYTTHEVAAILGIDIEVVRLWINHGLLFAEKLTIEGEQARLWIHLEALEMFRQTYVLYKDASALLGVSLLTINSYVYRGKLHPIEGGRGKRPLLLREEIESLKPARRH